MRTAMMMAPLMLVLAGCDRGIELTNASIEEVAAASKGAQKQQPGEWETTTTLEKVDVGDAKVSAQVADVLKGQVGQKQTTKACVTKDQVGSPALGDMSKMTGSKDCRFEKFAMKGGAIDATMRCSRPDRSLTVSQKGQYTETGFDIRSVVAQSLGAQSTTMTMHVTGKRTGDCPG